MGVKDLCLGVLTFGNANGYDIKKFFPQNFGHFYAAGHGSIYPELAELTAAGLVSCHALPQPGKPNRNIYHLTAAGRQAFLRTLQHTLPRHCVKPDFLLPPERLEHLLDGRLADLDRRLEQAQKTARHAQKKSLQAGPQFVCGYGRAVMSAARDYLRSHRRTLIAAPRTLDYPAVKSARRNRLSRTGLQSY